MVAGKTPESKAKLSAALTPSTFYSVIHTFVEGKAESWWKMVSGMTAEDSVTMVKKTKDLGYYNHHFIPASTAGPINCLWECKGEVPPEVFQKFIDGPDGPGEGVFVNKCYKVMGGIIPPSAFASAPPIPEKAPGSMFFVVHEFKDGASAGFFSAMSGMTEADTAAQASKDKGLGFYNHTFAPTGMTDKDPCICVWESKTAMSTEEFQKFIDGPDGPGAGKVFNNTVHKATVDGIMPSTAFA